MKVVLGLAHLLLALDLQQGLLDLRNGRYGQARIELEQASQTQPENAYVWVSLAEAYRRLNQLTDAEAAAAKAEKFGPAQPAIQHALALFYAAEGQPAHAEKFEDQYQRSLWERQKTDPQAAFQYAQFRLRKLDFSGADEAVGPALAAHPGDPQLVLTMGVVRYGQRRFEEAIHQFIKVIGLDPSIPQPYQFLGKMLEQAGTRLPEIRGLFETYAARNPDNGDAQLLLAKVRLSENSKDTTADQLLRRAMALDPGNWEAHYELGVLLEAKHDFPSAAAELSQASSLNPNEPMPHYHLARVYDRLGDTERAQAERQKHADLTERNPGRAPQFRTTIPP